MGCPECNSNDVENRMTSFLKVYQHCNKCGTDYLLRFDEFGAKVYEIILKGGNNKCER